MMTRALQFFRDIPIKRKLTFIIMFISTAALLLACTVILVYERHAFRETMRRDYAIIADTFGDNVASGLTFEDSEFIVQTLKTMRANPGIVTARVYDKNGNPKAQYVRADLKGPIPFPKAQPTSQRFQEDRLDTFQDITLDGECIGTFYIAADLTAITQRLQRSATIVFIVMAGALLLAFVLSTALQKLISGPILHLASIAGTVARERDYSLRAVKRSDDELGSLVSAFNEMLSQIQVQDSALHVARDSLELRVEERTRELAKSLSLLNATLDSTADGIIAIQFTGEVVCYNSQFAAMWEIPAQLLEKPNRKDLFAFIAGKTEDPEQFIDRSEESRAGLVGQAFDVINLKDGQTFERYVKPQQVEGKRVGVVINFRDITARIKAEARLAEANAQLLTTSRQAGMAEVATSILHNVGNVLNSVSVSAEVVATKVRQFRISRLTNLSELLRQNSNDLVNFLTTDPRGREVPEYLLKLVEQLAQPQQNIFMELECLRKNVEHIKEIVSMQQNYARGSGVLEKLSVEELLDDAIRINEAGFNRHELRLIRDIAELPPILSDRHKVLQILVNLLGNAKQALANAGQEKLLTVKAEPDGDFGVKIMVADTGIGIEEHNLTRIFQHGFTTKKNGHGFGLHSGALAARELGGNLSVASAGLGRGTTFTLTLPFAAKDNSYRRS